MRIALFFPPPAELTQPYLAVPALVAFLKSHGFDDVDQYDLGLEAFDDLTQPEYLRQARLRVELELNRLDSSPRLTADQILQYDTLFRALAASEGLPDVIEDSKRFFRERLRSDAIDEYRSNADRVLAAFRLVSAAHYPTEWTEHHFNIGRTRRLPAPQVLERARDEVENPFVAYFRRRVPDIIRSAPKLIGISVAFGTQVVPALTFAAALRDGGYDGHIVVGGAFISHCGSKLPNVPELFDVVDSFVVFAGEIPLLRLAEAIRDGKSYAAVPGLIFRTADGEIVSVPRKRAADFEIMPTPDFSGLKLGRYLSPRPILPVLTSRGCYFDRCTFCSHTWSYDGQYERREGDHVTRDVRALMEKHGAKDFYFVDECLSPKFVRIIAQRLVEEKLDIRWMADIRYESTFTRPLLELAHRSGCRLFAFGLESINDRVIALMDKATTREATLRIMNDCHELGIASNVMFFIGFPTETEEEAWETIDFILDNRERVDMVSMGTFQLNKNAKMHLIANTIGLEFREELPPHELSDFHRYRIGSGMSELEASKLEQVFLRRLHEEGYDYPLMSRTHALLVDRGKYGFMNTVRARTESVKPRPVAARDVHIFRSRYRVEAIRQAVRDIREHLRREALENLQETTEALASCPITVSPSPAVILAGRTLQDWAVDVTEADVEHLELFSNLSSVRDLAHQTDGAAKLARLLRLERLGVLQLQPD
jgi:anaerobic magnesium-protoporphyrin IX monomethyl ester cyclase